MTIISHISLPILIAGALNLRAVKRSESLPFSRRGMFLIGFCGMLPDLLTPHLSLHARYVSWSHSLWFLAPFLLLCLILAARLAPRHRPVLHFCWIAVLLHLLCDMLSGGLNPLAPFGHPFGDYYLPPLYWLHLDLFLLLAAYGVCWYARYTLKRGLKDVN